MNHSASVRLRVKPVCCRTCKGCGYDPACEPEEEPFSCRQCDGQGCLVYAEPPTDLESDHKGATPPLPSSPTPKGATP
jgi:hypothetical protein